MPDFTQLRDADIDGIAFAHRSTGSGAPVVLVHGVGPGTTAEANFLPLIGPLAQRHEVHLIDLIGFGASGRKPAPPLFDVELWTRQIETVIALLGGGPVDLIGNSVGGALALKAAARSAAVRRVVAIGAPAEPYPIPSVLSRFWTAPESPAELAAAMTPMTGPQSPPAAALVETRFRAFDQPGYRRYFTEMLQGGQAQLASAALTDAEVSAIAIPVTLIHGRLDRACPPELTAVPLSRRLPAADLFLFGGCGHNVIWERTDAVLALLSMTLGPA